MKEEKFAGKSVVDGTWVKGYLIRCQGSGKEPRVFLSKGDTEATLAQHAFGGGLYSIGPFVEVDPDTVQTVHEPESIEEKDPIEQPKEPIGRAEIDKRLAAAREEAARLGVEIDVDDKIFIDDAHRACVWYGGWLGSLRYKGYEVDIFVSGETHIVLADAYEDESYDDDACVGAWNNPDETLRKMYASDEELAAATREGFAEWTNNSWVEYRIKDLLDYWHDGDVLDDDVVDAFCEVSAWVDSIEAFDAEAPHRFRKRAYKISAERVNPGTFLYNRLEDCQYVTNATECIRMIGTVGEEWPLSVKELSEKYSFANGSEISENTIPQHGVFEITPKGNGVIVAARRVKGTRPVYTKSGHELWTNRGGVPHGDGDYIVYALKDDKIDFDNVWVVNGVVFPNTYEPI